MQIVILLNTSQSSVNFFLERLAHLPLHLLVTSFVLFSPNGHLKKERNKANIFHH